MSVQPCQLVEAIEKTQNEKDDTEQLDAASNQAVAQIAEQLVAGSALDFMGDYEKFCKGVAPGGGRIIACLAKQGDKIARGAVVVRKPAVVCRTVVVNGVKVRRCT